MTYAFNALTRAELGATMRHKSTQALYNYWNEVRGERRAPLRLEMEPQRLGDLLLDAFILEHVDRETFRCRLAGTRISQRFGMDLRDVNFLELWSGNDRAMLQYHLTKSTDYGRVSVFTAEAQVANLSLAAEAPLQIATYELLVLPLVHTGRAMDRLLCVLVPLDAVPGTEDARISRLSMQAAEAIWPTGESADDTDQDRQSPLYPHVRNSRLVRNGRRLFRVYDGGLNTQSSD